MLAPNCLESKGLLRRSLAFRMLAGSKRLFLPNSGTPKKFVGVEQALVPAGAVPLMVTESVQKPSAAASATYSL